MIRHQSGVDNKAADALSRRVELFTAISVKVTGFEQLKAQYEDCPDFKHIVSFLKQGPSREFSEYTLQDGYLFKNNRLCVSRTSVRDFLIWEIHAGGLSGHFGRNKTIYALEA